VIVRVLGSAAGGGVPQWNCACKNCAAVRSGAQAARSQSSFAVSGDGERWYLINVSPDVATQIEAFAPLQPRGARGTPIAGFLLTDANVDHLGGLAVLRQQGEHRFVVRSSAVVREIAIRQPAFAAFAAPPHAWLPVHGGQPCEPAYADEAIGTALIVRSLNVPGLTPGFDGRRAVEGAVLAFEVTDARTGGTVLFAPVFASVDAGLREAIARADVTFLDGSFFNDDEMPALGLGEKRANSLGHLPVGGEEGSLHIVAGMRNRRVFSHVNNSNPMLDPDSPAALAVAEAGAEVAYDGMELHL